MIKEITDSGSKAYQRKDMEDRGAEYRLWHRSLAPYCVAFDVDFIEWRTRGGKRVPVAITEITRVDSGKSVTPRYLDSILKRYNERDMQGYVTRYLANKLEIPAYIILYRQGCSEFWIYKFDNENWQGPLTPKEMGNFIESL
ncbi:hypothetical protein [Methanococcoides sp. NM1]|uniref:hypothetical protein n=1 Tax=Methanococcoides sp. NM1 TaxID=1201013 RepID=UPI0010847910|nr:hypothetical protein [Methanococcoides sp. NM1]